MLNKETIAKIDEYIKSNEAEILGVIEDLVKYPSVLGDSAKGAPFGIECRACLDAAVGTMKKYGFDARVADSGKYGLATYGSGSHSIGIFAHTDVVPVSPEDWIYTKPFEPKRIGNVLVGRGVEDNKAGVAASIFAVKALEAAGVPLKSKVTVFLGSNEECGMSDIEAYAEENALPDVSLVPDGGFPVCFGEKGICRAHIRLGTAFKDITEFSGGTAYNIMLDKLTVKIRYSKALEEFASAISNDRIKHEKDGDYLAVYATGLPRHAATPEGGINAAYVFASEFCTCSALCESDRKMLSVIADITSDFYGERLGIACSDECFGRLTSVNGICCLEEGVPNIALDIRYGTGIGEKELEDKILAAYPKAYIHENKAGFAIPRDNPIAKKLEAVYAELSGNPEDKGFYMGGGTYARYIKNAYSIGLQAPYIPCEAPSLPAGHGDAHQADEILRIPQFLEAVKIIALMLSECDE